MFRGTKLGLNTAIPNFSKLLYGIKKNLKPLWVKSNSMSARFYSKNIFGERGPYPLSQIKLGNIIGFYLLANLSNLMQNGIFVLNSKKS